MTSTANYAHNLSPNSHRSFSELPNTDLDCPNQNCTGWLRIFADKITQQPLFIKCSDEFCDQKTMLSKYTSKCAYCRKAIELKEIITCGPASNGSWVHPHCYEQISTVPYFALCQRCTNPIEDEKNGTPTTCGGKSGYCHIKCSNKRKLNQLMQQHQTPEHNNEEDTAPELSSSSSSSSSPVSAAVDLSPIFLKNSKKRPLTSVCK